MAAPRTFDGGDGGVVSTAADMADWLVVQTNHGRAVDGTQVISDRSLTEQHSYALGWDTDGPVGDPTRLEHTGNLLTYSAYMEMLPESGYGVVVLLNAVSRTHARPDRHLLRRPQHRRRNRPHASGPAGSIFNVTTLDRLLGLLTLVVVLLGVRGVLRAGRWARRRREQPWAHTAARTFPTWLHSARQWSTPSSPSVSSVAVRSPGRPPCTGGLR